MNSRFRVLSLNCKNEIYPNPFLREHSLAHRKERILSYLREIQPLCVGLQEFTDEMQDSILPRLSHYEIFGENRYRREHRLNEQTAILVNTDLAAIEQARTIWLSNTKEEYTRLRTSLMPRTCTVAKIRLLSTNQEFRFYNVHLDVGLPFTRYRQAMILLGIINDYYQKDGLPFIVVGDFNAHYDSKTIMLFRENNHRYPFIINDIYANSLARHQTTIHQFKKRIRQTSPIDYIFVSNDIKINEFSIVSDITLPLSDHFPILAEVEVESNQKNRNR